MLQVRLNMAFFGTGRFVSGSGSEHLPPPSCHWSATTPEYWQKETSAVMLLEVCLSLDRNFCKFSRRPFQGSGTQ